MTVPFSQIKIGDQSAYTTTVTKEDIRDFARISGDNNPVHLSEEFARATVFGGIIAHGMLAASYISTVLGTQYPGPGTIFLGLNAVNFLSPVRPGDDITTTVTVTQKHPTKPIVTLSCACTNQQGQTVLTAEAVVKAPTNAPAPAFK
jgi:acyl dehydratase